MLSQLRFERSIGHVLQVHIDGGVYIAARHGIHTVAIVYRHPYATSKPALQAAAGNAPQVAVVAAFDPDRQRTAVTQHIAHTARG